MKGKRQRPGVHRQDRPGMAQGKRGPDPEHRTGQPVAVRLCGELPRTLPGRMPEPEAAPQGDRGPGGHRGLPPGPQPTQAAQPAGLL